MFEIENIRIKVLIKLKAAIRIVQFIINRSVRMIIPRLWNDTWRLYALGNTTTINLQSTAIEVTSATQKCILIVEFMRVSKCLEVYAWVLQLIHEFSTNYSTRRKTHKLSILLLEICKNMLAICMHVTLFESSSSKKAILFPREYWQRTRVETRTRQTLHDFANLHVSYCTTYVARLIAS